VNVCVHKSHTYFDSKMKFTVCEKNYWNLCELFLAVSSIIMVIFCLLNVLLHFPLWYHLIF